MRLDSEQIVSITEANQNFSRVARMVDRLGEVVGFKNNKPKYRVVDVDCIAEIEMTEEEKIDFVAARVMCTYREAFAEMAK